MEVDAQGLGVGKDPTGQIDDHLLADPGHGPDERVLQRCRQRREQQITEPDRQERTVVVRADRRNHTVDRVRDQQRTRLRDRSLEHQQQTGRHYLAPARAQQRGQQCARRALWYGQQVLREGVRGGRRGRIGGGLAAGGGCRSGGLHRRHALAFLSPVPLYGTKGSIPDMSRAYSELAWSSS